MSRRTKIVATVGPASSSAEVISQLIDSGVNVLRLNFSHGSQQGHRENALLIRQIARQKNCHIGILGDLQGPKIRVGDIADEPLMLSQDDTITLTTDLTKTQGAETVHVRFPSLPQSVAADDILLLDDGLIRLTVERVEDQDVHCRVLLGGALKSRKGLNRLGGGLSAPAITEKDFNDIELAAELKLDFLAVSFPSSAADLIPVRQELERLQFPASIVAKIERAEAVANDEVLNELIDAADVVMVARGDLGVEIGDAQLMGIQKKIIRFAQRLNRPVITATQMMESMILSPVPTRAEVFDVANAVLDGTDAVMLSAETATGRFPERAVTAMADTCVGAEQHPDTHNSQYRLDRSFGQIEENIAMSAIYAANHMDNIGAIICVTESGTTARLMSRLSSRLPIYAISRNIESCNRMALYRGVIPIYFDVTGATTDVYQIALDTVAATGVLSPGQRVTITSGDITGSGGTANTLKILEYRGQ
jgi:pyruvate kinase